TGSQNGSGLHLQSSNYNAYMNSRVYEQAGTGILVAGNSTRPATYNFILNNTIYNTPFEGVYVGSGGNGQSQNHAHFTHVIDNDISTQGSGPNALMENAIDLKEYNDYGVAEGNFCHDYAIVSGGNGALDIRNDKTGTLVYDNTFKDITTTGSTYNGVVTVHSDNQDLAIWNNIFYNTSAHSDKLYAVRIEGDNHAGTLIAHNSIYNLHRGILLEDYGGSLDVSVMNNIWQTNDTEISEWGSTGRFTFSHNLYAGNPWTYESEPGRQIGSANWTEPDNGDFTLTAYSTLAIDQGDAGSGIDWDASGQKRNDGRPDIGCDESAVAATTRWFVATDGNDNSGIGSIDQPFATLEKAGDWTTPGDTIYVRGGTYGGIKHVYGGASGTAAEPVVITAYLQEQPVFDGTGVSVASNEGLFSVVDWDHTLSYIIVDGLEICHSSGKGLVWFDCTDLIIRNCTVHHIQYKAIGGYGHRVTIEDNHAFQAALVNTNGSMLPGGWPGIIQGSVSWRDGTHPSDYIIRNNVVHDCWGEGIIPGQCDNTLIEGNTVYDVFSVHIYLDKSTNVTVRNNTLYTTNRLYDRSDKGYPATAIALANEESVYATDTPLQNIQIYNNIIHGCGRGISYWQDPANTRSANTYVNVSCFHNTIVDPVRQSIWFDEVPSGYTQPSGCQLKNNIIESGQYQALFNDLSAWTFSHNDWVDGVPAFAQEPNSFSQDPLFVAPALAGPINGYKVQPLSPVIDAGVVVNPAVAEDIAGTSRSDDAAPDIGAFEFLADGVMIQLKAFLQGPFDADGDSMTTDLIDADLLPHESPFAGDPVSLAAFPMDSSDFVDWVLVALRDENTRAVLASQSGFVLKNGSIITADGWQAFVFDGMADGSYVLSVKSRNHLDVMSRFAVALTRATVTGYDFSTSADQAFGANSQIQLEENIWGLIAGDSNQDGYLTTQDYVVWYNQKLQSQPDYFQADVNLDGQVNQNDYVFWMERARNGFGSGIP
ncbi:hypothetical protein GF406_03185, partial [candidate division KSB1 bacterium]|nr:hypothetical protein [candidate division KSB1 bacterium]